jgi:hypothetical protein
MEFEIKADENAPKGRLFLIAQPPVGMVFLSAFDYWNWMAHHCTVFKDDDANELWIPAGMVEWRIEYDHKRYRWRSDKSLHRHEVATSAEKEAYKYAASLLERAEAAERSLKEISGHLRQARQYSHHSTCTCEINDSIRLAESALSARDVDPPRIPHGTCECNWIEKQASDCEQKYNELPAWQQALRGEDR